MSISLSLHGHHSISGPCLLSWRQISATVFYLVSPLFILISPEWFSIQQPDWFHKHNPAHMSALTEWPNPKSLPWLNTPLPTTLASTTKTFVLSVFLFQPNKSPLSASSTQALPYAENIPQSLTFTLSRDFPKHPTIRFTCPTLLYLLVLADISLSLWWTHPQNLCIPFWNIHHICNDQCEVSYPL